MVLTTEDIRRIFNVFQECDKLLEACCDYVQRVALSAQSLEPTVDELLLFDISKELYPKTTTYDEFVEYGFVEVLSKINILIKSMKEYWVDIRSYVLKSRMRLTVLHKLLNGENSTPQDKNLDNLFKNLLNLMIDTNTKIFLFLDKDKELIKISKTFLDNIMLV